MWPEALPPCLSQSDPNPPVPIHLKRIIVQPRCVAPLGLQGSQTYSDPYRVFCVGNRRNIPITTINAPVRSCHDSLHLLCCVSPRAPCGPSLSPKSLTVKSSPFLAEDSWELQDVSWWENRTTNSTQEERKTWGIQKFEKYWTFICGSVGVFLDVVGKPTAKYEDFVSFVVAICDLRCISI